MNLTNLSLAQSSISGASPSKKREVLLQIENCTKREAQEILATHFPEAKPVKESLKFISSDEASLHIRLSKETIKKLDQIKSKRAHKNPSMNYSELIEDMCNYILKKLGPAPRKAQKLSRRPRYISNQLKQKIFNRDNHQCTYINSQTQQRCGSKHMLQIDHRRPISRQGETTEANLRLLCPAHHRFVDQYV